MNVLDTGIIHTAGERPSSSFSSQQAVKMKQQDAVVQKRLEEDIAMRIHRNTRAPISRLPPEIMGSIFLFVKEFFFCRYFALKWIKVSHVSTVWRKIAIDFAELWSEPQFWNKHWAKEMIKRAKGTSLVIDLDCDAAVRSLELVAQIWPSRAGYFKELRVADSPEWDHRWHWFWEATPTSFALLEKLELYKCRLPATIATTFFSLSGADNLRKVRLHHCTVDWTGVHLPCSIKRLFLWDVSLSSPATDLHLFNSLEGLQSLEVLTMGNFLKSFKIDHSRVHHVEFTKLQRLYIESSLDEAAFLFRSITFASCMYLRVKVWEEEKSPSNCVETVKDLFTAIGQSFNYYRPPDLRPPVLDVVISDRSCELALFFEDPARPWDRSGTPSLSVTIIWRQFQQSLEWILFVMFHSVLPIQDVGEARILWLENTSPSTLAETFGRLPSLSSIKCVGNGAKELAEAIGLFIGGSTEMYFANLSTIKLHLIKDTNSFLSVLQDSLICRRKHRAEITKLVLSECSDVDSNVVDQLREIVVDVLVFPKY